MSNTLTQRVNADEQLQKLSLGQSLRVAGVLAASILVFVTLYYFVAALEVP